MNGSVFVDCIILSIAEKCTLARRQREAYCETAYDSFGTAAIIVATSSLLLKDTSSLTFSRKGNTFFSKNEKQVKHLMQDLFVTVFTINTQPKRATV